MATHALHGMNNRPGVVSLLACATHHRPDVPSSASLEAYATVVGQAFLPAAGIPVGLDALYSPPLFIRRCAPPLMNNSVVTLGKNRGCR